MSEEYPRTSLAGMSIPRMIAGADILETFVAGRVNTVVGLFTGNDAFVDRRKPTGRSPSRRPTAPTSAFPIIVVSNNW